MSTSLQVHGGFDLEREVQRLVSAMSTRFGDIPRSDIERMVRADFARLADATVPNFVPVLVEKAVVNELRALQYSA